MKIGSLISPTVASCLSGVAVFNPRAASAQNMWADFVIDANMHTRGYARPNASFVGVYGNRLTAVGTSAGMRKLAGIVLPSQDIFRINPVEMERTKVRLTIMDGRVVYEEKSRV
jgi:hypothetical protein